MGVGRGAGTESQLWRKAAAPVWICTSRQEILGHHLALALADYAPSPEIPHSSRLVDVGRSEDKEHLCLLRRSCVSSPPVGVSAANPFSAELS